MKTINEILNDCLVENNGEYYINIDAVVDIINKDINQANYQLLNNVNDNDKIRVFEL